MYKDIGGVYKGVETAVRTGDGVTDWFELFAYLNHGPVLNEFAIYYINGYYH